MRVDPGDVALCVAEEVESGGRPAPTSPPIVQTSLFTFATFDALAEGLSRESEETVYTRGRNPTVQAVEGKLAALERGEACICLGSGMAAISAVLVGLLEAGTHVLFVNHTYGPTLQLAAELRRYGVSHDVVLDTDPAAVRARMRRETRLVWLESPGTMLFRMADVGAIAAVAREHGALVCVDNSWATPLLQKPLELGADIVVHSATKYLAGHSDVVAGAVVSSGERIRELFRRSYLLLGGVLAPFDAWLLLRGLRTLPVRLRQHEADALAVARFLASHPAVARVHHPALREGGERELAERQLRGWSGLFSFELRDAGRADVARVLDRLRHFRLGVSWGGVESLAISPERRDDGAWLRAHGLPRGLIRLSVGLEGADLLIADLAAALE